MVVFGICSGLRNRERFFLFIYFSPHVEQLAAVMRMFQNNRRWSGRQKHRLTCSRGRLAQTTEARDETMMRIPAQTVITPLKSSSGRNLPSQAGPDLNTRQGADICVVYNASEQKNWKVQRSEGFWNLFVPWRRSRTALLPRSPVPCRTLPVPRTTSCPRQTVRPPSPVTLRTQKTTFSNHLMIFYWNKHTALILVQKSHRF